LVIQRDLGVAQVEERRKKTVKQKSKKLIRLSIYIIHFGPLIQSDKKKFRELRESRNYMQIPNGKWGEGIGGEK